MTKSFLTELRDLGHQHAEHEGNIQLLHKNLPRLHGDAAERARSTIQNLQDQQRRIDRLLLRAECDREV